MAYSYLDNVELNDALRLYLEEIDRHPRPPGIEEIPTTDALGRITAEAVYAGISSPHYNACAMDGIAVRAGDTFGATDTTPVILKGGVDFIRVDTGDPLPENCDAVVMIEDVVDTGDGNLKLLQAAVPWQHVRQIGEDICAGEMILPSNTRIGPAAIGAILAGGVMRVTVQKRLTIGLIPTGDELVSPSANPVPGKIPEFNSAILAAMLWEWGVIPKVYPITGDNLSWISAAIESAATECDLIIINAGSSAGREDFTAQALRETGKVLLHGIAIRPGKPAILGMVRNCPVIGVPGYPVSGMIVLDQIIKPVIQHLTGVVARPDAQIQATLSGKVVSSLKYQEFIRVSLGYVGDRFVATPLPRGAGVVTSFVKADGILEIPINSEGYEKNTAVTIRLLRSEPEIVNTVAVIGSHDQLIDIAADLMRTQYRGQYVSSSHVGSMGGIMAIKRAEAHLAGIHLLDETTGCYNTSYIKKYLGNGPIALIKCVQRIQGLMVAPGNPKNIKSIVDLGNDAVKYVNRQKGSGTRILLDYLLKRHHLPGAELSGYEREEYTHLAVAALVAAGSADAGLGVYSAAKAYHLDFIPLCEEEYDFIVPEPYLEIEKVKCFIAILASPEFRQALVNLGGYLIAEPGKIIKCE